MYQAAEFCPNLSRHRGNVTSYIFFKMAAAAAQNYFQFRICWCLCLPKVKIYHYTKFRRHNQFTAEILLLQVSKKCPPYWNSTSGFDPDYFAVTGVSFRIRLLNFVQIGAAIAEIWRHIYFSRWRQRPLIPSSGFAFVDVTAFRSKSTSIPNFVNISQFTAQILLFPVWKNNRLPFWNVILYITNTTLQYAALDISA